MFAGHPKCLPDPVGVDPQASWSILARIAACISFCRTTLGVTITGRLPFPATNPFNPDPNLHGMERGEANVSRRKGFGGRRMQGPSVPAGPPPLPNRNACGHQSPLAMQTLPLFPALQVFLAMLSLPATTAFSALLAMERSISPEGFGRTLLPENSTKDPHHPAGWFANAPEGQVACLAINPSTSFVIIS